MFPLTVPLPAVRHLATGPVDAPLRVVTAVPVVVLPPVVVHRQRSRPDVQARSSLAQARAALGHRD